jgi:hypothetical protein
MGLGLTQIIEYIVLDANLCFLPLIRHPEKVMGFVGN